MPVFKSAKQVLEKGVVNLSRRLSLKAHNKTVENVLTTVFGDMPVSFTILKDQVVFTRKPPEKLQSISKLRQELRPHSLSTHLQEIKQQPAVITGTVTDQNGESLIGVNIQVKGTTRGTVTDIEGKYSIEAEEDGVLVFSYVGYQTMELPVDNRTEINVQMRVDAETLEELIVVGYGSQSREVLTTSISKLDEKVLENIPYANAASALEGTVSGVRVQSTSGQPGAAPRVIIRGGTSINDPNGAAPLYVIDGIIRSDMNDISADDIESLQVLKDAGSTAIYGARASNGVVLIKTKSGKSGKTSVSFKSNLSFSKVGRTYDMAGARDFIEMSRLGMKADTRKIPGALSGIDLPTAAGTGNDLTKNTGFTTQYLSPENEHKLYEGWESMPDPLDPSKTIIYKETNWQDILFRTGVSQNYHLNINGGNKLGSFNAGIGYLTSEGIAITTKYNRLTFNLNSVINASDNLSFNGQVSYSSSSDNEVYRVDRVFFRSAGLAPTAKLYFEDATLAPGAGRSTGNPLYHLNNDISNNNLDRLTLALGSTWNILDGLSFEPKISLYKINSDGYSFIPSYLNGVGAKNETRSASSSFEKNSQFQIDALIKYNKQILRSHNVDLLAGYSLLKYNDLNLSASSQGAATDLIPTLNAAPTLLTSSGIKSNRVITGYFGRINYDYERRYLISLTGRYDGASNLGKNHKWGFFPGISLGWNLHNENFWNTLPENFLHVKLRASYGQTGNIGGLSDFQAQGEYNVDRKYLGSPAILNSVIANSLLKWEQSTTFDIGMDIGLFNRRINLITDYYNRVTNDLLTSLVLPPSTGFNSIFTNYGSLENKGFEVELDAQILNPSSEFQWNISINSSKNINKILSLPENGTKNNRVGGFYVWVTELGDYDWVGGLQEGGEIGDLFAWKQISIYRSDEEASTAPVDQTMPFEDRTKYGGDANYLDKDNNGILDTRDLVIMGNSYPKWTGGITNTFVYKSISLSARVDYMAGHTIYNQAKIFLSGRWANDLNFPQDMVDKGWKMPGDDAEYTLYIPGTGNYSYWRGSQNYSNQTTNSKFYERGDFLNIREITLMYQLPVNLKKQADIADISLYATGNNIHYFTNYTGTNPEEGGLDTGRYPIPKSLIFGVKITF